MSPEGVGSRGAVAPWQRGVSRGRCDHMAICLATYRRSVGLTTNNYYFTELHSKVSVLVFGIIELIFVASKFKRLQ